MTTGLWILCGLFAAGTCVTFWLLNALKTAPEYQTCVKCNGDFPKYYITTEGICEHCDYQNKANQSLGNKTK